jgi:hypothetical protein
MDDTAGGVDRNMGEFHGYLEIAASATGADHGLDAGLKEKLVRQPPAQRSPRAAPTAVSADESQFA